MAIFGNILLEKFAQVLDKTRLDATASFISKDEAAVTLVEIEPEASAGFVDVTSSGSKNWFLDWEYSTDGIKVVSLRITTDGAPVVFTESITVLSVADDALLSNDSDLVTHEPDIMKWVRSGRNSYLDMHRRARDLILDWLDENNWCDINGDRLTSATFVNKEPFRKWATFLTLSLIYGGISNAIDDVFRIKSAQYDGKAITSRDRGHWKIDLNNDAVISSGEGIDVKTLDIIRR